MVTLEFSKSAPASVEADTVAVFATKSGDGCVPTADATAFGNALGIDLQAELAAVRFEGDLGEVARVPTRKAAKAAVLLVVGLGDEPPDTETLRKAAGTAARNAQKDSTLAVVVPSDVASDAGDELRAQAMTEGAGLGAYAYTEYRTKPTDLPSLRAVLILAGDGTDAKAARAGVDTGVVLVEATCLARDLVNTPPAAKRPPELADRMVAAGKEHGVNAKVLDEKALAKGGFGGIIGVGQGSSEPPRLVELSYEPFRAEGHVVLVGKGITFDSGGLSLKPSLAMTTMKSDMSGAAAVLATMVAAARLGLKTKITGLLALAENMPSGTAVRVSDVLTHRGGKTVEVLNTDAEGRLVLADALAYGAESKPDVMIDIATLTGAQVVALGTRVSGLMGTDDGLCDALLAAAEHAGEGLWRLPLHAEYAEHLRSEVADLKNIGKPLQAGTIVAGLFLKEFTAEIPWAHLDIAGPSFTEEGDAFYTGKGATGTPVRTLVRYLQARSN